ncbi:uncharacterized protein LOC132624410 [Lycium barbarum]|uniref:uncharacterized protein LOC132624410 n=1 Tax=Lycium barbarum TaxID=112863 RepID=UPI00293E5898|nr:uncharacterized protein LOC132624410 [Lycium barbarum]
MIPKVENPQFFSDLRPISLCNVTSKIISKLINTKLASILPNIISKNQSGFIKGRMISESILLAQEIINNMNKPNNGGNLVIKLDMAKAYDKVSWPYLCAVLRKLGFDEKLVDLVFRFISNNWYSLVLNGGRYGFFKSENGLRQGDPLSPSLFVLSAELLSVLLNKLHDDLNFRNFYIHKNGPKINHLCFADDVILFTSGNRKSLKRIMRVLRTYEEASSQIVNKHKSSIILHPKASSRRTNRAARLTGMKKESFPFQYLGSPLYLGRKRISTFSGMIDKILARTRGWNNKFLSTGGKSILLKHVLQAMPSHLLAVMHPLSTVFEIIEKEFNRFFWSGVDGAKRQHWASRDNLSFPYTEGGANFRKLMDICKAYSAKQWWRFRTQDSLWSQFLKTKYSPDPIMSLLNGGVVNPTTGNPWLTSKKKWRRLFSGILVEAMSLFGTVPNWSVIRDAFNRQNWYWNACGDVPDNIKDHILHMNLKFYDEEDKPCWMKTNSGNFSTGSAWNFLRSPRREVPFMSKLWNKIIQPETLNHIFLDGPLAAAVWNHFGCQFGIPSHFNSLQLALDTWWNSRPSNPIIAFLFKICPIIITWFLWKTRCSGKYGSKKPFLPRILYQISQNILNIVRLQFLNFKYDLSWMELTCLLEKKMAFKVCRTVFWKRPAINFLKINSDGSHKDGSSGGGGVIRDSQGKMIMAYSIPFDEVSNNVAEAKALLFGIQWSIQNGINSLELETDSMILAAWVKDVFKIPWQVDAIKRALTGTSWSIKHCFREANKVADTLASLSHSFQTNKLYNNFDDLPLKVKGLINLDKAGFPNFRVRNKKAKEINLSDVVHNV